jgi:hypothetical protein
MNTFFFVLAFFNTTRERNCLTIAPKYLWAFKFANGTVTLERKRTLDFPFGGKLHFALIEQNEKEENQILDSSERQHGSKLLGVITLVSYWLSLNLGLPHYVELFKLTLLFK